jgi:hypothetical protein
MKLHKSKSWVLGYECIGFGMIIALCWVRELTGLAHLVFGGQTNSGDWRDASLETVLVLLVWAVVFVLTLRLVGHLLYLEGFLRVCAWCRKIGYKEKWIPLEEYFQRGFHVGTTHAVCPECCKKVKGDTARFWREQSPREEHSGG